MHFIFLLYIIPDILDNTRYNKLYYEYNRALIHMKVTALIFHIFLHKFAYAKL
jgi:hypothetical protein